MPHTPVKDTMPTGTSAVDAADDAPGPLLPAATRRRALASAFGAALAFACARSRDVAAADSRLVITGSSTLAPLVLEIGKRFEHENPGVRVDVQAGGSSRGIADARSGLADIGLVSRALTVGEFDLTALPIAMDGICMVVHRSNPVAALTRAQIVAIYTGAARNWADVGGENRTITVVNKAEGRSTLDLFLAHFGLRNSEIRADVVIGDNQQGVKTIAGNPGALGYVSIGTAEFEAARGAPLRLLAMDGIPATSAQVAAGRYPIARPLNLVVRGAPSPLVRRFLDFARSASARDLVAAQFFVPVAGP